MDEIHAVAFVSWGRWVADCPLGCGNAEHFGPDPDSGHVGGLTGASFTCGSAGHGCGLTCAAHWPDQVAEIEAMLAARPAPNRNWRPGEDLHDLLEQNLRHGLVPAGPLGIVDNKVVTGSIEAGIRPAIGER